MLKGRGMTEDAKIEHYTESIAEAMRTRDLMEGYLDAPVRKLKNGVPARAMEIHGQQYHIKARQGTWKEVDKLVEHLKTEIEACKFGWNGRMGKGAQVSLMPNFVWNSVHPDDPQVIGSCAATALIAWYETPIVGQGNAFFREYGNMKDMEKERRKAKRRERKAAEAPVVSEAAAAEVEPMEDEVVVEEEDRGDEDEPGGEDEERVEREEEEAEERAEEEEAEDEDEGADADDQVESEDEEDEDEDEEEEEEEADDDRQ